jgi:hypothetical protein
MVWRTFSPFITTFDTLEGKCMDFNYRATTKITGFEIDKVAGDDLRKLSN